MLTNKYTKRRCSLGLVARMLMMAFACSLVGRTASAEPPLSHKEAGELLQVMAAQLEENYSRIKTWQGKYRFSDDFDSSIQLHDDPAVLDKKIKKILAEKGKIDDISMTVPPFIDAALHREGVIEFTADIHADRVVTAYREDGSKGRATTTDGKSAIALSGMYKPFDQVVLLRDGTRTILHPHSKIGALANRDDDPNKYQGESRVAHVRSIPRSFKTNASDEVVDPRELYNFTNLPFWVELRLYSDALLGNSDAKSVERIQRNLKVWRETVDGLRQIVISIKFESSVPVGAQNPGVSTQVIRFNEANGMLPLTCTNFLDGKPGDLRIWRFKAVDGIQIPSEYHITIRSEKKLWIDRQLDLVEASLNPPLPTDAFEVVKALNLENGDRVLDIVDGSLEVVKSGQLQTATKPGSGSSSFTYWAILLIAVLGVVGLLTIKYTKRRCSLGLVARMLMMAFACSLVGRTASAEPPLSHQEAGELLQVMAAQLEENYSRIKTWQGKYRFSDDFDSSIQLREDPAVLDKKIKKILAEKGKIDNMSILEGKRIDVALHREGVIEFTLDIHTDRVVTAYREDGSKARATTPDGKSALSLADTLYRPFEQVVLLRDGTQTRLDPKSKFGALANRDDDPNKYQGESRVAQTRKMKESLTTNASDEVIDPRELYMFTNLPFWEKLRVYGNALLGNADVATVERIQKNVRVSRESVDGQRQIVMSIKYESSVPVGAQRPGVATQVIRFDEANGILPLESVFSKDGKPEDLRTWRFKEVDGIQIPSEYHVTLRIDKKLYLDRQLNLMEASLNPSLSADAFEVVKALALENGDRVLDIVDGSLEVVKSGELRTAAKPGSGDSTFTYLAILLVAILCVVAVLALRRFRR